MQEEIKKESGTAELGKGDGLSLLVSLALTVAFSFALALLPVQRTVALLCIAWLIVFVLVFTQKPKS